jgi:hypothetical protein
MRRGGKGAEEYRFITFWAVPGSLLSPIYRVSCDATSVCDYGCEMCTITVNASRFDKAEMSKCP